MAPHDLALRATGVTNLFCGGEKAGPLVGHTEGMCTGTLAGRNAALGAAGEEPMTLPPTLATGDAIRFVTEAQERAAGWDKKITFSGSAYFARMEALDLYTTDPAVIGARVREAGMDGVFSRRIARRRTVATARSPRECRVHGFMGMASGAMGASNRSGTRLLARLGCHILCE